MPSYEILNLHKISLGGTENSNMKQQKWKDCCAYFSRKTKVIEKNTCLLRDTLDFSFLVAMNNFIRIKLY